MILCRGRERKSPGSQLLFENRVKLQILQNYNIKFYQPNVIVVTSSDFGALVLV